MSNTEIERFLEGLNFVENPWIDRAFERVKPKISWIQTFGGHCAAGFFGVVLGTVIWQFVIFVTMAELVTATAQVQ